MADLLPATPSAAAASSDVGASSQPRIKLYWLLKSRAQSIGWLLEELGLEYEIEVFERLPSLMAPTELAAVHPLGKSPVVTIAVPDAQQRPVVLAESGCIAEYLCERFGGDRGLIPRAADDEEAWLRSRHLLHYVEGSLMPVLLVAVLCAQLTASRAMPWVVRPVMGAVARRIGSAYVLPNARRNLAFLDNLLATSGGDFICGPRLTAADILLSYPLVNVVGSSRRFDDAGRWEGGSAATEFPRLAAYVDRLCAREAYKRAEERCSRAEAEAKLAKAKY